MRNTAKSSEARPLGRATPENGFPTSCARQPKLPLLTHGLLTRWAKKYNPAVLSHLNLSETTDAEPPRLSPWPDRFVPLRVCTGSERRRQRSAGTHSSGREEQFANP